MVASVPSSMSRPKNRRDLDIPNTLGIQAYMHCSRCLKERPDGVAPKDWAKLSIGFTNEGLQVWCNRHNINVMHVHFEGYKHPANLTCEEVKNG